MKKFKTILLVSAMLAAFYVSATAVFAETTYTWVRCGSSYSGTMENGMLVMHNTINDSHTDGEQITLRPTARFRSRRIHFPLTRNWPSKSNCTAMSSVMTATEA